MFSKTLTEKYKEDRAVELENAYLLRDLITDQQVGSKLWRIIQSLLSAGEALAFYDMQKGKKKIPIYESDGAAIAGYREEEYSIGDFHSQRGLIQGLRWLPGKIEELIRLADKEDQQKAKDEVS